MNTAKAIILAIYCDHPAGRKCCLCESACPQCFKSKEDFAKPPIDGTMLMRTHANVAAQKNVRCNMYVYLRNHECLNVRVNVCINVCLMYVLMYLRMFLVMYLLIYLVMYHLMYVVMYLLKCTI
jgi:hypothetical protein